MGKGNTLAVLGQIAALMQNTLGREAYESIGVGLERYAKSFAKKHSVPSTVAVVLVGKSALAVAVEAALATLVDADLTDQEVDDAINKAVVAVAQEAARLRRVHNCQIDPEVEAVVMSGNQDFDQHGYYTNKSNDELNCAGVAKPTTSKPPFPFSTDPFGPGRTQPANGHYRNGN